MTVKTITREDFVQDGRDFVLRAIDEYIKQVTEFDGAKGWRDVDLPRLIPALDNHFDSVARRFSYIDSAEPGSINIKIVP